MTVCEAPVLNRHRRSFEFEALLMSMGCRIVQGSTGSVDVSLVFVSLSG